MEKAEFDKFLLTVLSIHRALSMHITLALAHARRPHLFLQADSESFHFSLKFHPLLGAGLCFGSSVELRSRGRTQSQKVVKCPSVVFILCVILISNVDLHLLQVKGQRIH